MQRLRELSRLVEAVYDELDHTFGAYQRKTGLACRSGCGSCCNNPEIDATPLEMLPLALNLYDQGRAEQVLEELEQYSGFACFHYVRHSLDGIQGQCGVYQQRPALCRMFGAAGVSSKTGGTRLSVCRTIKQDHNEKYQQTLISMLSEPPPRMATGKERVRQLDFELGKQDLPINQALKYALERVLFIAYYSGDERSDRVA
ncbi:YkgJ family cysteine cluster protein [Bowmanella dokdonensis]|uniref:YkgJ family cysteine cluster protein n=1 Tax=Bowmanella dokdonensis TaxID=751969 RepID=A0A939DPS4_9ALTE|nr:YkgJ family cysteine cluster protein [Bowmanella dokdonensis]MBN7825711.1 YkgJ family cysteine cluster protein [Bowmanella dokdonensis]